MKIAVVGAGYVGLVTANCLAEGGHQVVCIDLDDSKIEKLKNGAFHIQEPGLNDMLNKNLQEQRLAFSVHLEKEILGCDFIFITVGTPTNDDLSVNCQAIFEVSRQIARATIAPCYLVIKSTVPPLTHKIVKNIIKEELQRLNKGFQIDVVSNPEFMSQGTAINNFLQPHRVVIGSDNQQAGTALEHLYSSLLKTKRPIIHMDNTSAEMVKYTANVMLASRLSLINELSLICENVGVEINNVLGGITDDPRIGPQYLRAGIGYGGSCLPKDVKALIGLYKFYGLTAHNLQAIDQVNEKQVFVFMNKIKSHFKGQLKHLKLGIWGLSFKPETNDIRNAPAIKILDELYNENANIHVYDPNRENLYHHLQISYPKVTFHDEAFAVLDKAEALMILTEWPEFLTADLELIKNKMEKPLIFDGRNIFSPQKMRELGLNYYSMGRPSINVSYE